MSDLIPMTLDEEFCIFTSTLMNNWSALKLVINHSDDDVPTRKGKVESLYELLMTSTRAVIYDNSHTVELVEELEEFFDLKFNTYIDDNSCEEILNVLLNYYNLLLYNKREDLPNAVAHLSVRKSIFSSEEYHPEKIYRVATPQYVSHRPNPSLATVVENDEDYTTPSIPRSDDPSDSKINDGNKIESNSANVVSDTDMNSETSDSEWTTVHSKRNKNK